MHDMNCGCKSVSKKNHPVLTCKRSLNERLGKCLKNLGLHINRPISSSMDTACLDTPTNQIYEIYRSLVEKTYPMLKMNVYIFSVKTTIFYLICRYTDWLLGERHLFFGFHQILRILRVAAPQKESSPRESLRGSSSCVGPLFPQRNT